MTVPTRPLGRTGVHVSAIGLGGFHLGIPSERDAIAIVRHALDSGITFLDNCWDYNDGESERRMGKALEDGYRQRAFLMTKIDGRTREAARDQIDQSLQRLRTDVIDLLQIHEVIRMSDADDIFTLGVIDALVEAKNAGRVRHLGFTGHKDPQMLIALLEAADRNGFAFDTMQFPLNVLDHHWNSFEARVVPEAQRRGVAILGMKPLGAGEIPKLNRVTASECLRYALSLPANVVITGCESIAQVDQAVAASNAPLTDDERRDILARTAPLARRGAHEKYKTTHEHDGTIEHPHWLKSATL